ncbi:hypothetical protein AVEN_110544-1 [Araneus ventricosus]|uniref:Uncharacterized protein n=1 Tax=Araneus ventricosus TaxID=182803 RepID=A0A4Y2C1G6_ARAVE|nr:hypothetical protein AVEN_110544-1 [Araneus ventricosus]
MHNLKRCQSVRRAFEAGQAEARGSLSSRCTSQGVHRSTKQHADEQLDPVCVVYVSDVGVGSIGRHIRQILHRWIFSLGYLQRLGGLSETYDSTK